MEVEMLTRTEVQATDATPPEAATVSQDESLDPTPLPIHGTDDGESLEPDHVGKDTDIQSESEHETLPAQDDAAQSAPEQDGNERAEEATANSTPVAVKVVEEWPPRQVFAATNKEAVRFQSLCQRASRLRERAHRKYKQEQEKAGGDSTDTGNAPAKQSGDTAASEAKHTLRTRRRKTSPPPPPPSNGTQIVPAGPKANAIRRVVAGGLSAIINTIRSRPWTWEDHVTYKAELRHYLEANISVMDLRMSGVLRTYTDLSQRFKFSPANLAVNRRLMSANQLRELFSVGWEELLIDYGASPYLYLAVFKLPLEDIASLGITLPTLMKWDPEAVYKSRSLDVNQGPISTDSDFSDAIVANMRRSLDREMFLMCDHYLPRDWNMYLNMTYRELRRLRITADDLMNLWRDRYNTLEDILTELGWDREHTKGRLPRGFEFSGKPRHDGPGQKRATRRTEPIGPAPGSLRQMRSQTGTDDDLFEAVRWDIDTERLEPGASDDTSSEEDEPKEKRKGQSSRPQRKPKPASANKRSKKDGRRRRRKRDSLSSSGSDAEDGGIADMFPVLSNLFAGSPSTQSQSRSRQRRRRPGNNNNANPSRRKRRSKADRNAPLPVIDDDDD